MKKMLSHLPEATDLKNMVANLPTVIIFPTQDQNYKKLGLSQICSYKITGKSHKNHFWDAKMPNQPQKSNLFQVNCWESLTQKVK